MSDLTKILAENQKELLKLIVPSIKKLLPCSFKTEKTLIPNLKICFQIQLQPQ